jgi:hypothetical protein
MRFASVTTVPALSTKRRYKCFGAALSKPSNCRPTSPTPHATGPNLRYQVLADFATLRITVTGKQLDAALIDAH